MKRIFLSFFVFFIIIELQACGGSGGTEADTGGVTTDDLVTLANLPDLNLDSLDAATSVSANRTPSSKKALRKQESEDQQYSVAGCEARSMRDQFMTQVVQFQMNLCIMKAMETHAGVSVGDGSYNYYDMSFTDIPVGPEGEEADMSVRVKVGLLEDTMRLLLCEQGQDSSFDQFMAMHFTVTDGKFDGQITDQHVSPFGEGTDSMRIGVLLETDDVTEFADGDTATITGEFASEMWGGGSMNLEVGKAGEDLYNTISGAFQSGSDDAEWGSWTSQVYSKYDGGDGCSQYSGEGSIPAMSAADILGPSLEEDGFSEGDLICWKEVSDPETAVWPGDFIELSEDGKCSFTYGDTECFTFDLEEEILSYFVLDDESAAFFDEVSAVELPEFSIPDIDFEGDDVWSCEAEDGDFTEVDLAGNLALMSAMDECFALNEGFDTDTMENCYDKGEEEFAETEVGEDFNDGFGDDAEGGGGEGDTTCTAEDDCEEILGITGAVCSIDPESDSGNCTLACSSDDDCADMEDTVCTDFGGGNTFCSQVE